MTSSVSRKRSSQLSYTPAGGESSSPESSARQPVAALHIDWRCFRGDDSNGEHDAESDEEQEPQSEPWSSPRGPVCDTPFDHCEHHRRDAADDRRDASGPFTFCRHQDTGNGEGDSEGDGQPAPSDRAIGQVPAGGVPGRHDVAVVTPCHEARRSAQDRCDEQDACQHERSS